MANLEPAVIDRWLAFASIEPEHFAPPGAAAPDKGQAHDHGDSGRNLRWLTPEEMARRLTERYGG